ncbi:MAG: indole-3-glycerol-phosphate synthase TrpC, partial [Odoribacter sp.]|nr:indole-3-glycerol-phosphate synthase TrpC [Odoribacter sp.]
TDIYTSFRLASQVPVACLKVAESGIRAMETVVGLHRLGFRGFLIGEHFMREAQPAQALKNFVGYAD